MQKALIYTKQNLSAATVERQSLIDSILQQHVPFPNEPFNPRPTTARVYRTPKSLWGRKQQLAPVAFKPSIFVMIDFACTSSHGTMDPYLFVTAERRLVCHRCDDAKFTFVRDPLSISDEDIDHLRLGVQGSKELLDDEYDKALAALIEEAEQSWIHPFSA